MDKNEEYIVPSAAAPMSAPSALTAAQVQQWREQGYVLVDGVLPEELVEQTAAELTSIFGVQEEWRDASGAIDFAKLPKDFGSAGRTEFPTGHRAMDLVALHPRLLQACAELLGCSLADGDMLLSQCEAWPKYYFPATQDKGHNRSQRMHFDYPNHSLVVPVQHWQAPESVGLIVYYDDCERVGGGTAVVARQGPDDEAYTPEACLMMPGTGPHPYINDREAAEAYLAEHDPPMADFRRRLYAREKCVRFRRGTVLFYHHAIWHRGTPLNPPPTDKDITLRVVQNISYKRADCPWFCNWNMGWARSAYREDQVGDVFCVSIRAGEVFVSFCFVLD